jgi:hypothetical protein
MKALELCSVSCGTLSFGLRKELKLHVFYTTAKLKVNLSLRLIIEHQAMTKYGGVAV